ncbi:MAG TPA: cytochrome c biogenesis protein CcsA [Kofleriaceae bacterium]|jgi:heme exporter protein C|nr:cytochrome c biogenesis protein CcsA [Kofleriaceae bacterium]
MKGKLVPIFSALAAVGFAVSIYCVFFVAPLDFEIDRATGRLNGSSLFFNQKIVYFHVAHAFVLFTAVFVAGISSALYLRTRKPKYDDIASASVDVAVAFGAAVLATGSIWAKAAWGVWWQWEPRLTMSLLLWLILVGYVLVRRFAGPSADRVAAGMAIFGMVGVPFIYVMVGQDSHPASGPNGVAMNFPAGERGPFWLSVATFMIWFVALVLMRIQSTRAERELRELRERGMDLGVL